MTITSGENDYPPPTHVTDAPPPPTHVTFGGSTVELVTYNGELVTYNGLRPKLSRHSEGRQ